MAACLLLVGCASYPPLRPMADSIVLEYTCGNVTDCAGYRLELRADGAWHWQGLGGISARTTVDLNIPEKWIEAEEVLKRSAWDKLPSDATCPSGKANPTGSVGTIRWTRGGTGRTVTYRDGCGHPDALALIDALEVAMFGQPSGGPPRPKS